MMQQMPFAPSYCRMTHRSVDTRAKRSGPHVAGRNLLLYMEEADVMLSSGERMLSLVDDTLVLLEKGAAYTFAYGTRCRYYCLAFETEDTASLALLDIMLHKRTTLVHLKDAAMKTAFRFQMAQLTRHLGEVGALSDAFESAYTHACVTKLLLDFYALQQESVLRPPMDTHQQLARELTHYLDAHYLAPLTLEAMERAFFRSRFHLCRVFQGEMGLTIFAYLRMKRADHAAALLTETNQSVLDICFASGFQNVQSFYTAFRQRHGKTPLQYRKQAQ